MSTAERGSSWKREAAKTSLLLSAVLGGIGVGNALGASSEIAGIKVRSQVTLGSDSTFGVGEENIRIDTNIPFGAGLHVQPEGVMAADFVSQLPQLSDTEALARITAGDTLNHLGKCALVGGMIGLLAMPAYRRRNQLLIGLASGAAITGLAVPSYKMIDQTWYPVTLPQEFTVNPSIHVSGSLLRTAAEKLAENEAFYAQAALDLKQALAAVKDDPATTGLKPFIAQTDQHCNIGAARLTRTLTEGTGADTVLLGGDFVSSGWDVEKPCNDILARYLPKNAIGVGGNHDSDATVRQLKEKGITMLVHQAATIDGITYYGASDPLRTAVGQPTVRRNKNISPEAFAAALEREVCQTHPNVLIVHNPRHTLGAADCADLTLLGHMHAETPPRLVDEDSMMMTMANAGGSVQNTQNIIGGFNMISTSYILYFDEDVRRFVGLRRATITPAGKASVGNYEKLPEVQSSDIPRQTFGKRPLKPAER